MQIIVFKNLNGSCGVIHPSPKAVKLNIIKINQDAIEEHEEQLEDGQLVKKQRVVQIEVEQKVLVPMTIEEIAAKDVPEGCPWRIVDIGRLPQNREFRDAWTDDLDTDTVDINMPKARDIHLTNIRAARAQKFIELGFPHKLDSEVEEAFLSKQIRNKLQALRDIPQTINLDVHTPEELSAIWPEELKTGKLQENVCFKANIRHLNQIAMGHYQWHKMNQVAARL